MACRFADFDESVARYKCSESGDECMFLMPSEKACYEKYQDGPIHFDKLEEDAVVRIRDGHAHCGITNGSVQMGNAAFLLEVAFMPKCRMCRQVEPTLITDKSIVDGRAVFILCTLSCASRTLCDELEANLKEQEATHE